MGRKRIPDEEREIWWYALLIWQAGDDKGGDVIWVVKQKSEPAFYDTWAGQYQFDSRYGVVKLPDHNHCLVQLAEKVGWKRVEARHYVSKLLGDFSE